MKNIFARQELLSKNNWWLGNDYEASSTTTSDFVLDFPYYEINLSTEAVFMVSLIAMIFKISLSMKLI